MWRHSVVYNAVLSYATPRLNMRPAELSWHLIWLWHEGMIALTPSGFPVPARNAGPDDQLRAAAPRRMGDPWVHNPGRVA